MIRDELTRLHKQAGSPTMDSLKSHADLRGHSVGRSTLASVLRGEGALRWATVAAFIDACAGYAEGRGQPLAAGMVDMTGWRDRFDRTYPGERPASAAGRRFPWLVPPAMPGDVDRPDLTGPLVEALTADGPDAAEVVVVHGTGGFGKTTLVRQSCHRDEVRARFPGGAIWIELGETLAGPDLALRINDIVEQLTGTRPELSDPRLAGWHLGAVLDSQPAAVLLVLDDVWHDEQVQPFLLGGRLCRRVVTTRQQLRALADAHHVPVDVMTVAQSRSLLLRGVAELPDTVADELVRLTGRWPLLLDLANRNVVRRQARDGPHTAASAVIGRLRAAGPTGLDGIGLQRPGHRDRLVGASMAGSIDLLTAQARDRYLELGIFAEGIDIPLATLELLWGARGGLDPFEVEQLCATFHEIGLLVLPAESESPVVRLHDVVRGYVRAVAGPAQLARCHAVLVDAAAALVVPGPDDTTTAWWRLPVAMDYLWRHLVEHLVEAGRADELDRLVTDLRWVAARVQLHGVVAVEADLARSGHPAATALMTEIRRNAHLLAPTEPAHALLDILVSRLDDVAELRALVGSTISPRLVNRFPPPDRPHAALWRTIHAGRLNGIGSMFALSGGPWLATISDGLIRIWDVTTGNVLRDIRYDTDLYHGMMGGDGSWLAMSGLSTRIEISDVPSGELRGVVDTGHRPGLGALAIAPDAAWIVTAHRDGSAPNPVLRVWDAHTGQARWAVDTGHPEDVHDTVVAPDGTWLATRHGVHDELRIVDQDVRIWDAATGALRHIVPAGSVSSLVIAPDSTWLAFTDYTRHDVTGVAVVIVDAATGHVRHLMDIGRWRSLGRLLVAPDGSWLAIADYTARDAGDDDAGSARVEVWVPTRIGPSTAM